MSFRIHGNHLVVPLRFGGLDLRDIGIILLQEFDLPFLHRVILSPVGCPGLQVHPAHPLPISPGLLEQGIICLPGGVLVFLDSCQGLTMFTLANQIKSAEIVRAINGASNIFPGGCPLGDDLSGLINYLVEGLSILDGGGGEFVILFHGV